MSSKKIVAFFIGYSPDFNGNNCYESKNIGGSEIALVNLTERLVDEYDVYVFGFLTTDSEANGVYYRSAMNFSNFMEKNKVEILVISRYIHAFLYFFIKASKIFIWCHDVAVHPAYKGLELDIGSGALLFNFFYKINGMVLLSEWHKNIQEEKLYPFIKDSGKISIIGNAVDDRILELEKASSNIVKVKNSFIFAAHHSRGIDKLMGVWPYIIKEIPDATLRIFGEEIPEFKEKLTEFCETYKTSVTLFGKVDHLTVFRNLLECEVWLYITAFPETYCMLALEAQLAGCICITSPSGGLPNTLGNRGFLIGDNITDELLSVHIKEILNNSEVKNIITNRAKVWARNETWNNKALLWKELFNR